MKSLWIGLLCLLALSSCVSKKKFVASESRGNRLQTDSIRMTTRIGELEQELLKLQEEYNRYQNNAEQAKVSLLAQLDRKSAELSEKDLTLQKRAEKLRQLQEQIEQQQAAVRKLRKIVADALISFSSEELTVNIRDGRVQVSLSDQLLFESASAKVNEQGKKAIGKLAVVLKNNPDINIEVAGHTDSLAINTARYKDNWDLSVDRAVSIVRLLQVQYGISGSRIRAAGKGEFDPVADNKTKEGRAKNRRTEIYLTPKLDELYQVLTADDQNP